MPDGAGNIRVLCLHGAMLDKNVFKWELGPLSKAIAARGAAIELVFDEGKDAHSVELQALQETEWHKTMHTVWAAFKLTTVYTWATSVDTADGRQFSDLPAATAHVQELLRRHAPIDGLIGMSQGAMLAHLAVAQAAAGEGAPLAFAILCGGCRPAWHLQRPDLYASPLLIPCFIVSGAHDLVHQTSSDPGCHASSPAARSNHPPAQHPTHPA
jgi:hypothetical protein